MTAPFNLKDHGVSVPEIHRNLPPSALYEHAFAINRERARDYLNVCDRIYCFDALAGWDHPIKVRVICSRPYHALFRTDVDLSRRGRKEALEAGRLLKSHEYSFDCAYTSLLKRAIRTLWFVLDELDLMWIPVEKSWRLNERRYGALQGLNKAATAKRYSDEQVHLWRRSYDVPPPALTKDDERHPIHDPRYKGLPEGDLPCTECLKDTVTRFLPYWSEALAPSLRAGHRSIIAGSRQRVASTGEIR